MSPRAWAVLVAAATALLPVAGCSTTKPAAATATTAVVDPTESTSTTTTTTTLPPANDQDIRTMIPGVLTVATERLTAPWYNSTDPATVTGGFEYDLAKALAARLRVSRVQLVVRPLVTVLSGEDCGCDIVLSEVAATDQRARRADLTEPYLIVDKAVLVRQGTSMTSITAGRSFRWGVALDNGEGLDLLAKRVQPIREPAIFVDPDDAIRLLVEGRIDAVMMPTPNALEAVAENPSLGVAGQLRTGEPIAAVLTLGSPNTAAFNDAIRDMRDDGTIALFLRTYFGMNPADVPEIPS